MKLKGTTTAMATEPNTETPENIETSRENEILTGIILEGREEADEIIA